MSDDLPGTPIDIPLPPDLLRAFGYAGDARYVAIYYSPIGDQALFDDGRSSGTAQTWAYLAFRRHRTVAPLLDGWNLGYSDEDATHCLVIDTERYRASRAPLAEARSFLQAQHPPVREPTPEEAEALQRHIDAIVAQGWREEPVDMSQVVRAMEEQRGRIGRMLSWLDQYPTPPEKGRRP